jgi:hypothetical protein
MSEGLDFLNGLSGRLRVTLTEEAQPMSPHILNLAAPASATLVDVSLRLEAFGDDELRPLTEDEWASIVIDAPSIRMRSSEVDSVVLNLDAPNGLNFTVKDIVVAVEQTERASRPSSKWFGGIDVHHVYFDGLELEEDGVWCICWGS